MSRHFAVGNPPLLTEVQKSTHVSADNMLYLSYYGMHTRPFSLTPDIQYFFSHTSAQDAMNKLMFSVRSGEGFTKITGEIGTGKTLLCRAFLASLEDQFITAYIPNPYLQPMTLLLAIADELGVEYPQNANQHNLLKCLTEFLVDTYSTSAKRVVVCLDDAHALPLASLEMLRLLSNLETPKRKLLQLVLFGQPELDLLLEQQSIRQLKQRIVFSAKLKSLNADEIEDYVVHRINVSGYRGPRLFNRHAIRRIASASRGVPRLINILAHKALIAAYAERYRKIKTRHVVAAIDDTDNLFRRSRVSPLTRSLLNYVAALSAGSLLTALASQLYHLL